LKFKLNSKKNLEVMKSKTILNLSLDESEDEGILNE
jgi:hypothetical protein